MMEKYPRQRNLDRILEMPGIHSDIWNARCRGGEEVNDEARLLLLPAWRPVDTLLLSLLFVQTITHVRVYFIHGLQSIVVLCYASCPGQVREYNIVGGRQQE